MNDEIEKEEIVEEAEEVNNFATIGGVYSDGVSLIFDAQQDEGESEKHYRCNSGIRLAAGDRVRLIKDSGTYVVEYPIGEPNTRIDVPSGGKKDQVLYKKSDNSFDVGWKSISTTNGLPTGGTSGQFLKKNSEKDYDCSWSAISVNGVLPSGGSLGQYLKKNSSKDFDCTWDTISIQTDKLTVSSTNNITLNSSHQLVPHASSSTYPYSIGSSSYPFYNCYFGEGTLKFGTSATTRGTKIGFYGSTPITQQKLITTSANMSYTSATASNYLNVINNIAGILKKLGLLGV